MIVAFAVLLLGNNMIAAQDDSQFKPLENAEQQSAGSKEQEDYGEDAQEGIGYHPEGRQVGTPIDVDQDLDNSFPKRDHLLPRLLPKAWFQWKEDLYEKYNLKLGISYQAIYQHASSTTPNGDNEVAAGWALLEGKWTAFNRDKNFEGSIVATLDSRHPTPMGMRLHLGDLLTPARCGQPTSSMKTGTPGCRWPTMSSGSRKTVS
jgi:hypothetical protein